MRRFASEFLGTAFLLMVVVGSGIMGEKLAGGNVAIALLANSIATGAGLLVIIQCLGPISGAHLNPVVSLTEFLWKRLSRTDLIGYWAAQCLGAIFGVLMTHVMFNLPLLEISKKPRENIGLWVSEFIATFGSICVIALPGRKHAQWVPVTVALYITSAYWFTSSTSFANPAVTIARSFTDTFCGIAPSGISYFLVAQIFGALVAFYTAKMASKT
jgi:glycerol uptake facilitator-like aquaporin